MLMTLLIAIVFIALAVGIAVWAYTGMATNECPRCSGEDFESGTVIPIIPGFKWWCINCNNVYSNREVKTGVEDDQETDLYIPDDEFDIELD